MGSWCAPGEADLGDIGKVVVPWIDGARYVADWQRFDVRIHDTIGHRHQRRIGQGSKVGLEVAKLHNQQPETRPIETEGLVGSGIVIRPTAGTQDNRNATNTDDGLAIRAAIRG